jgi:hypothetical protein
MANSSIPIDTDQRLTVAIEELRCERRRTVDEYDALGEFADRVRSIPIEEPVPTNRRTVGGTVTTTEQTGLERVREAYQSTLMSVSHYREEYDDTYAESLAGEFSPELAAALTDESGFTRQRKQTLLSAVSDARSARDSLLDVIDREHDSLLEATADLVPLAEEFEELRTVRFHEESFGALDAYRTRLRAMVERCEAISHRRQEAIFDQRRIQWLPTDVPDVTVYFYQDLDVKYPVMAIVAELLEAIAERKRRVERAMTRCRI